ncbi:hypothetical protein MW887_010552 [Aspergillus wentii]|nr:hypothetical protein MW887_010552 [Aspergillus wentii]
MDISEGDMKEFSILANASQIVYGPLIFITKLSILLLYLRVFRPSFKNKVYFFIQLLIWFNFCFYLADTVVKIFECTPRKRIWDKNTPGTCININIPILVTSAINVASDFQILLLPIICVWHLQMRPSKKLWISGVFAAGLFGCVSSLMRLIVSVQNKDSDDKTYDWFPEFLWTTAEIASGIIASCLPALPKFFRFYFRRAVTKISQLSTKGSSHEGKKQSKTRPRSSSRALRNQKWSRGTNTTELSSWELDDTPIFQGTSYTTTEAKAEPVTTTVTDSTALTTLDAVHLDNYPKGILKTVEVDVESEPGEQR